MNTPQILKVSIAALLSLPTLAAAADRNWISNPGDGNWNSTTNWAAGIVPVNGDNIFIHTPGSINGVAVNAGTMVLSSGTIGSALTGFTFGTGTYNVGTIYIGEGATGTTLNNSFGRAFINGGTTINAGSLFLGDNGGTSGQLVQNGGDVNLSYQFRLGHWPQGGLKNTYDMNGGSITVTGAATTPLVDNGAVAGNFILGVDSSGIFNFNAGAITVPGVTMQTRGAGGGESFFNMNGGTLNLGFNGFITSNPNTLTSYDINLGGGTVHSTAAWNSNLEIHLVAGTGIAFDTNGLDTTLSGAVNGVGSLTKNGNGTLSLSNANGYIGGGATVNGGVLNVSGQSGGNGGIRGVVTVNAGAELRATGAGGAIFGYNTGSKVDTLNINEGLVNSVGAGDNHIWNATVNMTGGELRINGGVSSASGFAYQWTNTPLNTFASANTAVVSGRLNFRADNSNKFVATVADGAAATDLLVSAAITHTGVGIFKLGPGTMEMTGGATALAIHATGGTLTLSGSGSYNVGSLLIGESSGLSGVAGTGEGTLNFKDTVNVTTGTMSMGENSSGTFHTNTVNHTGGSVTVTGNSGEGAGFRLGHWPNNTSTYNLSGGSLSFTDPTGGLAIATDGTGIWNQTGGALNVPQVIVNHRNGGGNATFTLQGGTANIGAGGIVSAGGPAAVNLGGLGGTLAATAAWSSSLPATLSGTGAGGINFDTTGGNITMSGALTGAGGLSKVGNGTLILSGANSYTGGTAVSAGTLRIGNSTGLGGGDVSVSGGLLDLAGKGVATTDSPVGAINLSGGAISFGIDGAASDRLSGTGTITLTGSTTLNLVGVGGAVPGTYTLLSGTNFTGAGSIALGSTPAGFYTWTPNQTLTTYEVTVVGAATPSAAYWAGSVSGVWSDSSLAPVSNWRTNAAGTADTNQIPGSITDVFFATATAGNLTNTLGSDFSINSLTVASATTGAVTINGANNLVVGAGGISRQLGAGALTVATSGLALSASQTWSNDDAGALLTVSAPLSGSGNLTTAGAGVTVLGGNNAGYAGVITVSAGTLQVGAAGALGLATSNVVIDGTLDLNGNSVTKADLSGNGVVTSGIAGAASIAAASGTFGGVIQDGSGSTSLVKNGNGTLYLTGANTYSGGTTINSGTLVIGNGGTTGALGSGQTNLIGTLLFAKTSSSVIDGDVNPAGAGGRLILTADGDVTLASGTDLNLGTFETGLNGQNDIFGGTLNVGPNTSVVVQNNFTFGNTAGGGALSHGIVNQTGGTVTVNAPNNDGRNFVLGHWNQGKGTYDLSGGTLNAPTISMAISWDGEGTFNLSGTGVANMRGLRFGHNAGRSGVFNLTGGELNLGVEGIWEQSAGLPNDINLGGGIVRAAVNTHIDLPSELTGTNGDVTYDTNGNTLTVTGALSGSGGFTKTGNGRMVLNAANSATGIFVVNAGTLSAQGSAANRIPAGGLVQISGTGVFEFGSTNPTAFTANYQIGAGGTLTNAAGVAHAHIGSVQLNGGTWTTDAAAGSYNGENYQIEAGGTVSVGGSSPSLITKQGGSAADRGISWQGPVTFDVADVTGDATADLIVSTELENSDTGSADLVKAGAGTMRLSFENSYTGSTTVNAGTLEFAVSETLTSLTIADGATVVIGTTAPPPAPAFALDAAATSATQPVPEPGSATLLVGGILTLLGFRRRRA